MLWIEKNTKLPYIKMVSGSSLIFEGIIVAAAHISAINIMPMIPACAKTLIKLPPDSLRPTTLFAPTPCAPKPIPMMGDDSNSAILSAHNTSRDVFFVVISHPFLLCIIALELSIKKGVKPTIVTPTIITFRIR